MKLTKKQAEVLERIRKGDVLQTSITGMPYFDNPYLKVHSQTLVVLWRLGFVDKDCRPVPEKKDAVVKGS